MWSAVCATWVLEGGSATYRVHRVGRGGRSGGIHSSFWPEVVGDGLILSSMNQCRRLLMRSTVFSVRTEKYLKQGAFEDETFKEAHLPCM